VSTDLERLLAAAADDSNQPLHTDVDDILARGRRSVRRSRIASASTAPARPSTKSSSCAMLVA